MSELRLEASRRAGRFASFAEFHTQVVMAERDMYGWVDEKFYHLYPGGRCIDYTETIKRDLVRILKDRRDGKMTGLDDGPPNSIIRY